MVTGWLGGPGRLLELGERAGHDFGTSLRRSTHHSGGGRSGGPGRFGPFGAKGRSTRVTERSVRTVRVREGVGGDRSRVGE
eukprot:2415256-Prymnesium_polylepis.1